MEKVVHCRDVGFDCNGVIRAKTEEEALKMAAEHARKVHGIKEITPEIAAKVKSVIREEQFNAIRVSSKNDDFLLCRVAWGYVISKYALGT